MSTQFRTEVRGQTYNAVEAFAVEALESFFGGGFEEWVDWDLDVYPETEVTTADADQPQFFFRAEVRAVAS